MADPSALIDAYSQEVQETVLAVRSLILEMLPGCIEMVDIPSKFIAYGYGSQYADLVAGIAPFKNHVNLMFNRGVDLPDPQGLLEGTGKIARHVKLARKEDTLQPGMRDLLGNALALYQKRKSESA